MTSFVSSSNLSGRMRELARVKRHCRETLKEYADELDMAVERYILQPSEAHLGAMLKQVSDVRQIYAQVAGRPLSAD